MTARRPLSLAAATVSVPVLVVAAASPAHAEIPGVGIVRDAIGGASGWAFDKVAEGIAGWVLGAVAFFVEGALDFLQTAARPDVESVWFAGAGSPYATVRDVAGVLLVGFVFLGLIQGLVQGDPAGMVRRVAGNLPLAVVGMVVTTSVVARLLDLTDALSEAALQNTGNDALHFLSGFGAVVAGLGGGFAAVLLGLVAALAGLVLWVLLIVRSSLVYVLVAISPLGFAATLWPAARGMLRRTVEILLAVILAKLAICIVLAVGVAALSGAGESAAAPGGFAETEGAGLTTLLSGAVLLGLAAFSPFLVLKLIPAAEGAMLAQGIAGAPARGAQSGMSVYSSARSMGRLAGGQPSAGGGPGPVPGSMAGGTVGGGSAVASSGAGAQASGAGAAAGPAGAGAAVAAGATRAVRRSAAGAVDAAGSAGSSTGERVPAPPAGFDPQRTRAERAPGGDR